jgi:hypothetical protein
MLTLTGGRRGVDEPVCVFLHHEWVPIPILSLQVGLGIGSGASPLVSQSVGHGGGGYLRSTWYLGLCSTVPVVSESPSRARSYSFPCA